MTKIGRKINILGTLVDQVPDHSDWGHIDDPAMGWNYYQRYHRYNDMSVREFVDGKPENMYVYHGFDSKLSHDDLMMFIKDLYPDPKVAFESVCDFDECFNRSDHICFECGLNICSRHGHANLGFFYIVCDSCYDLMRKLVLGAEDCELGSDILRLRDIGREIADLEYEKKKLSDKHRMLIEKRFLEVRKERPEFGVFYNIKFTVMDDGISFYWDEDDPNGGYFQCGTSFKLDEFFGDVNGDGKSD